MHNILNIRETTAFLNKDNSVYPRQGTDPFLPSGIAGLGERPIESLN